MNKRFELNRGWRAFLHEGRKSHPKCNIPPQGIPVRIPGVIHSHLFEAGIIPDPFFDMNEKDLQWIDWNDYRYECQFDLPDDFDLTRTIYLKTDGLDTIAEIYLNGRHVASAKNMFRSYRFKVNQKLKPKQNQLQIIFKSARWYGHEYEPKIKQLPSARHPERVYLRKSQYSFGWDWGPQFATCGIWRPIYLEQADYGIEAITFDAVEFKGKTVTIQSDIFLWGEIPSTGNLEFKLDVKTINGETARLVKKLQVMGRQNSLRFDLDEPALWWPRGYGQPTLHNLEVQLKDVEGNLLEVVKKKVGIRKRELVTEENEKAVFYFKINDQPVFAQGANWIPAHAFLPEIKEQTYERLLIMAAQANMNMLRVWGGGIYEDDYFYELCDSLGLMVWQDFMFACATYPENEDFIEEVKAEVEETVLRLRHHPSIVLWNGNNEIEWIWYRDRCGPMTNMPGYRLFHEWLPAWMHKLDPYRPYWPTSPWGMEEDPNDEKSGNRHAWNIWSEWVDYTQVKKDQSLFVTEFGFQAPAHFYTLKKALPADQFSVQSESFEWHNKQDEGNERLFRFLAGHLPVKTYPRDFVYLTQLNQAFALRSCLRHWRGRVPDTMGAVIWQLNDCWPVTSWALIDYELRPKLSYYHVKEVFAREAVYLIETEKNIVIRFSPNLPQGIFRLGVKALLKDGKSLQTIMEETVTTSGLSSPVLILNDLPKEAIVLIATLYDQTGQKLSRDFLNLKPWKYLKIPYKRQNLKLEIKNGLWLVCEEQPCFFVEVRHPERNFENQGFILLPGERERLLTEKDIDELDFDNLEIFCLNQYLA